MTQMKKISIYFLFSLMIFLVQTHVEAKGLTLDEVIASVKKSYPLIQAAVAEARKAESDYLAAQGGFDPTLKSAYMNDFGGYYNNHYADISVEQPTPFWGTRVFTGWRKGIGNFPIYDAKMATFDGGEARIGIEVPLLKGGMIDDRRARIQSSEQGVFSANENMQAQLFEFSRQAAQKYWDWVAAGRKILIAKELLEIALQRDEAIHQRIKHGDAPEMDQIDNQRAVLQRRSGLIASERNFQKATFDLALYYRDLEGHPVNVSLDQLPDEFSAQKIQTLLQEVEKKSVSSRNHPELKKLSHQANQLQVDYQLSKNQVLPKLDFKFGVYSDFGVNPRTYYLPASNYPTEYRASVNLEFPLFFRTARGKLNASLAAIDKIETYQNYTRDKLNLQTQEALVSMKAAFNRLELARNEIELAIKLEKMERIRASHGDSSILFVNLREQTTRDAMVKEVEAYTDFYKAKADFEAAASGS